MYRRKTFPRREEKITRLEYLSKLLVDHGLCLIVIFPLKARSLPEGPFSGSATPFFLIESFLLTELLEIAHVFPPFQRAIEYFIVLTESALLKSNFQRAAIQTEVGFEAELAEIRGRSLTLFQRAENRAIKRRPKMSGFMYYTMKLESEQVTQCA